WRAIWRSCQASRIVSTSGKYLYSVARPMPACAAILDIVTDDSPCSATSAAVASRVASWTARRGSSTVSVHSLGTPRGYTMLVTEQFELTATECLDKTGADTNRLTERTPAWLTRRPTPAPGPPGTKHARDRTRARRPAGRAGRRPH